MAGFISFVRFQGTFGQLDTQLPTALVGERFVALRAQYLVVDVSRVGISHDFLSGARNRQGGPQQRAYHTELAREVLTVIQGEARAGALEPAAVLDSSEFAHIGPPVVLPDFRVLSGHYRTFLLRYAAEEAQGGAAIDSPWQRYQAALREAVRRNGAVWGLSEDALRGVEWPVLVRLVDVTTPTGTMAPDDVLLRLNELSDHPVVKPLDPIARARSMAARLDEDPLLLQLIREQLQPTDQLNFWGYREPPLLMQVLQGRSSTRLLLDALVEARALWAYERPYLVTSDGTLRDEGKILVLRMLFAATLGDAELLDGLWSRWVYRVGTALPVLLTRAGDDTDLYREALRRALDAALRHLRAFAQHGVELPPEAESTDAASLSLFDLAEVGMAPAPDEACPVCRRLAACDCRRLPGQVARDIMSRPVTALHLLFAHCIPSGPELVTYCSPRTGPVDAASVVDPVAGIAPDFVARYEAAVRLAPAEARNIGGRPRTRRQGPNGRAPEDLTHRDVDLLLSPPAWASMSGRFEALQAACHPSHLRASGAPRRGGRRIDWRTVCAVLRHLRLRSDGPVPTHRLLAEWPRYQHLGVPSAHTMRRYFAAWRAAGQWQALCRLLQISGQDKRIDRQQWRGRGRAAHRPA